MIVLRKYRILKVIERRVIIDSVNAGVKVVDLVDELVHIDSCRSLMTSTGACKPIRDVLVCDAVSDDRIDSVLVSANSVYSLDHLGNFFLITINHIVHVTGFLSLKTLHR